jgi:mannose-1-phosphate guanylyltransferase
MKIAEGGDEKEIYPLIPKGRTEEWTEMSVKAGEGMMMEVPFEWWDFGTWESVAKYLGSDENNNFVRSKKYTAIIGLNDLVVVETEDALLICKKELSGKVGEVVEKLKTENKTELL